jgi:predicted HAD superfamily Cof-like phosphohydrolase
MIELIETLGLTRRIEMPIGINVDKAKEIHKDKIRAVRNPLLQEKDVEYMRALEAGDTDKVSTVVVEKQALRDATSIINDVTPTSTDVLGVTEELKQVWDTEVLGENPLL